MKSRLWFLAGGLILQFCCITAQDEEQDTSCESNADCAHHAVCHPFSKMCICKNGQSNYPACMQNVPTNNICKDKCQDYEYCDLNGVCQCKWGGMSRTNCCRSECRSLQSCMNGQCECKYGEYGRGSRKGRCRSCKRFCERQNGFCHHRQRRCKCKRGYRGRFPRCIIIQPSSESQSTEESTEESTEPTTPKPAACPPGQVEVNGQCEFKKEVCPDECGPGGECFTTDGRIICITCAPGYEPFKMQCRKIPVWAAWGAWSDCSVTCGSGTSKRERNCIPPDGKCREGSGEETKECEAGKACGVNCGWCNWSLWSQISKNSCNRQRTRSPECPARQGVGTACAGNNRETSVGKRGNQQQCDIQRVVNSVFEVWCDNGCIEITKVVHDCLGWHNRNSMSDELKRVQNVCEGKSHCRLTPDSNFFGRTPACQMRNRPAMTWLFWRCNNGHHRRTCQNGQAPMMPMPPRRCFLIWCFGGGGD